jgi:4'-phosphopantetheinyl transferase
VPTAVRIVRIPLCGPTTTRALLATALATSADALDISRVCRRCGHPSHGRPVLAGGPSFNVSHSHDVAVVALAPPDVLVGIDVEHVRTRPMLEQLAARVLAADELAHWRTIPVDDRLVAFLRHWTRREAYLKAIGLGIATRLADVCAQPEGWTTTPVYAGDGYVAAVAVDRTDVMLSDETAG